MPDLNTAGSNFSIKMALSGSGSPLITLLAVIICYPGSSIPLA
jgi:hypothetical protein